MVFSSLVFICAFLPLSLIAYRLCGSLKAKNISLLIFSLIFYTWGEPKYVLLLMAMCFFDWFFALKIQNLGAERKTEGKKWVALACVVNLGLIGVFKYSKMVFATFGVVPDFVAKITLPLGISFYTFQLLSYVIDVYRGEAAAQKEYWHVLLFAALFHQCIAGPIVRYRDIAHELFVEREDGAELAEGCRRFAVGLAKKVILANACGEIVETLLLSDSAIADTTAVAANAELLAQVPVLGVWLGLIVATFQIYFDFSAYSDMAIGMGLMLGLHYPENFNYPYMAKTAGEYWRRWHMTLGQWFRDYLYYPLSLGVSVKIRKFFSKRFGRKTGAFIQSVFSMLIVWACTGLWHGASWGYVLWGLYWCFFMILEQAFLQKALNKLPGVFSHIYLLFILLISRAFFRFDNSTYALTVIKGLFGLNGNAGINFTVKTLLTNNIFLVLFCVAACTPIFKVIGKFITERTASSKTLTTGWNIVRYCVIPLGLMIISVSSLVGDSYNPFIYFRF